MHNVCYREFSDSTPQREIVDTVLNIVARSGDRYGTDRIKFFDPICDNVSAAHEYIKEFDRDFYGGYAVRYYDFSKVKDPQKVEELEKKIRETLEKKKAFADAHSVKNQKAAFIGCPKCGSKLNRERMRGNDCPLCYSDLRSESTLNRLASYDKRIDEYNHKIDQERLKEKKKAKIMWLVKFEYHS
jgi:hypothetical protein